MPQKAIDTAHEIADVLVRKRIAERKHRAGVNNLREFRNRRSANPQGWTIRPHQMREARFYRIVTPLQRVILGIGNLWPVIGVIELIMMRNFARQPFQF